MSRTNDSTAIRTAVIGQKEPLFLVGDEKDMYYDLSLQTRTGKKNKCAGQHRILRTGYPGQDNRTAPLGQDVQQKYSVK
jgi:hypothetical protein